MRQLPRVTHQSWFTFLSGLAKAVEQYLSYFSSINRVWNSSNEERGSSFLSCFQINPRHSCCASLNLAPLLLDLNIDVVLIQEPYAKASSLSSSIELKSIPLGYVSFSHQSMLLVLASLLKPHSTLPSAASV